MATLTGHVLLADAAGKTLRRSVELEESIYLEWDDGSYTYIVANYDDGWSEVTPGGGWMGFSEREMHVTEQSKIEEKG